jgi:hypothetical protein
MPEYDINAYREIYYAFEIEAENVEAIEQMRSIERTDTVEDYACDRYPLEIDEANELD